MGVQYFYINSSCFFYFQETRRKEGIVKLKPHEEPLRSEILSGKFTILVSINEPLL